MAIQNYKFMDVCFRTHNKIRYMIPEYAKEGSTSKHLDMFYFEVVVLKPSFGSRISEMKLVVNLDRELESCSYDYMRDNF